MSNFQLLYPLYAQLPDFLDTEQRHQFLVFADDATLNKLVGWMNLLAEVLECPKDKVAVSLVNATSKQSSQALENAGQVAGSDWREFNDQQCLRLTLPRAKGPADLQAHRFHMTLARILLSRTDALVGYKYCKGVHNEHPEDDVWVARSWNADSKTHTQHRVLPKRLGEPINRLIAVVSELRRNHGVADREV